MKGLQSFQYRWLILIVALLSIVSSCKDKEDEIIESSNKEVLSIEKCIKEGSLLLKVEQQKGQTLLFFESDTITIHPNLIYKIEEYKDDWKTKIVFKDNVSLDIPSLGKSLKIEHKEIELNPTGYAPLSFRLTHSFHVEGRIKVRIKSKNPKVPDIEYLFGKYGYNHQIDVHGLYPDYNNKVYITLTDKQGKDRLVDSVSVKTETVNIIMPQISVTKFDIDKMEDGLTLVSYVGDHEYDTSRPFMIDAAGDIRWYLSLKKHPKLQYFAACSGLKRMRNGNFLTASIINGDIYELNMVGEVVRTWNIGDKGFEFHRDLIELPGGNFLLAVSKANSLNLNVKACVLDYMIEVDRESGAIVTEWDFKQSLDEKRDTYTDKYKETDWAHQNAIFYSEKDHTVIVSNRFQGLAKLDWKNKVKWILAPHKGWNKNARGEYLSNYLFKPLDINGKPITNNEVVQGNQKTSDFDWPWGPHCPVLMPSGRLLVFDNGYYRHHKPAKENAYSRAVEYQINESSKTIQQTWEFGKELGQDGYSSIVSSVQYLEKTDHILFGSGAIGFVGHGVLAQGGGRIIEVDYKTKEVVFEAILQVPNFYVFHRATRMSLYP